MHEPHQPGDVAGAQRTLGVAGVTVLLGALIPLLGLVTSTREHLGVDAVTLGGACAAAALSVLAATLAYRRLGPSHRMSQALDIAETAIIQGAFQGLVFFSTLEVSPLWFLPVAHMAFASSLIGSAILRPSIHLMLGLTALHALLAATVRQSLIATLVTLLVLGVMWAMSQLALELERRVQAAEASKLDAERRLAEGRLHLERARIARDLHDTVGADLSAILWSSEALKDRTTPEAHPDLETLEGIASRAIDDMRTAVWALRDPARTWDELTAYLRSRCHELCQSRVELDWQVTPSELTMPIERSAHIVRAVLEAVRNAAHHSGGTRVSVSLELTPRLRLVIADDGRGFASSPPRESQGLASLRERAEALNATLQLSSGPSGTTVIIETT